MGPGGPGRGLGVLRGSADQDRLTVSWTTSGVVSGNKKSESIQGGTNGLRSIER